MKEKTIKKINKYLNLIIDEKVNGYLVIGVFDRKKDRLNTFGVITGEVAPDSIVEGVENLLVDAKLIPSKNSYETQTVEVQNYKDQPTDTDSNQEYDFNS